ncbi:hypothetical protein V1514DRAFT_328281 [Lipomyces japonicus]|uniref:uncharacterized protein n=1 Tax=Lipomyces japonicus TaxID=56871 RepID=UPI0034CE4369
MAYNLPPGIQALQARMMPQLPGTAQPNGPAIGPNTNPNRISWAITKSEKKIFDDIFDAWDGLGRGFISGDTAVEILSQSGLPREDLQGIWTLSDPENRGRLNKSEFSVAMHLVYRRLNGYPLPAQLPPELIPPSTRNFNHSVSTLKNMLRSDATQRKAANSLQPQATGVSYLKAHSFQDTINQTQKKKDATVFKNNDDDITAYVSSARHRSRNNRTSPTPSPSPAFEDSRVLSKGETLEQLRKSIREKQILLNAIDAEDDLAYDENQFLHSRDRNEADDLIRKIKHLQEDISEYTANTSAVDTASEKHVLRNQLQYLTDRLPVLIGRARNIGTKIADAKLELFRINDAKAHPGQQVVGTGPGGRVTEADKRKAKSMAILQARMAALTGKPVPATGGDDSSAAEMRLAEVSDRIRIEKDGNEQMVRDVEDSVQQVQDSLSGLLRENKEDFHRERERQQWEDGIGTEDEVKGLIEDLGRSKLKKAVSTPRVGPGASSIGSSSDAITPSASTSAISQSTGLNATATGTASTASTSRSLHASQFRTPQERAAWIKSEAERRMNERLAALGISRPGKTTAQPTITSSSSAAFVFAHTLPAANTFSPSSPAAETFAASSLPPQFSSPPVAAPVTVPATVSSAISVHESTPEASSYFSPPVTASVSQPVQQTVSQQSQRHANTRNPFPVQEDYDDGFSTSLQQPASSYRQVGFAQSEQEPSGSVFNGPLENSLTGSSVTANSSSPVFVESLPKGQDIFATNNPVAPTSPAPQDIQKSLSPFRPPPASSSQASVTQPPLLDPSVLAAQRRSQRGHGDDDDDWSVVPSEDSSDDEGPDVSLTSTQGGYKRSPADLASMLFGMGPSASNATTPATEASSSTSLFASATASPAIMESNPNVTGDSFALPPAPPIPSSISAPPPAPQIPSFVSAQDGFPAEAPPPPASPAPPIFGAPAPPAPPPAPIGPPANAITGGGLSDRNALLGQITAGKQLRKVQTVDKSQNASVGKVL